MKNFLNEIILSSIFSFSHFIINIFMKINLTKCISNTLIDFTRSLLQERCWLAAEPNRVSDEQSIYFKSRSRCRDTD